MSADNAASEPAPGLPKSPAATVRRLLREAASATLGTLDSATGHPYASLLQIATSAAGNPVLLISALALHTRNLRADNRASVLVDRRQTAGDALAAPRATLIGRATPGVADRDRRRFLARHPEAEAYSGFGDFGFWRLTVERAHYIGGFGRIREVAGAEISMPEALAVEWGAAEPALLQELNAANRHHLGRSAGTSAGPDSLWTIIGVDAEGLDLRGADRLIRLDFAVAAGSVGEIEAYADAVCRLFGAIAIP